MNRRTLLLLLATVATGSARAATKPAVAVHKNPWCGCCGAWAAALRQAGYGITLHDSDDLAPMKKSLDIPDKLQGCHTALVEGYYVEGHVPLDAIARLLKERPAIAGLAVPGMPKGSLGMGSDPDASYDVFAVSKDGSAVIFQHAGN
ncbi:DUF411 domain-containing protein [Mesorhizobium amorphae]|uniref:DUF411 domain-containing protein n=1 Tax=Mesorhizobium amorphae TaxID=71433 RepID=UPI00177A7B23|nr:DUF411 domain-containing protein [Mesorhizobium amorphae]